MNECFKTNAFVLNGKFILIKLKIFVRKNVANAEVKLSRRFDQNIELVVSRPLPFFYHCFSH